MRPMRKSERERFLAGVRKVLTDCGATHTPGGYYEYALTTIYGPLGLSLSDSQTGGPGAVFARFDDPARAEPTHCNPYTGKWNHHYFDGWTVDAALADFARSIAALMRQNLQAV